MHTYFIDYLPLDDPQERWALLANGTAFSAGLSLRSVNLTIPGVFGDLPVLQEPAEAGALSLRLEVRGVDHATRQRNLALLKMLLRQGRVVGRDNGWGRAHQSCKLVSISEPETLGTLVRFTAVLRLPGLTWRTAVPDWQSPTVVAASTSWWVDTLAGSTEAIRDALILLSGPATNLRIADTASGAWVQYNGTVPSGTNMLLDCAKHQAWYGAPNTFAVAGTPSNNLLTFGPQPPAQFLPLTPVLSAGAVSTALGITATMTGYGALTHIGIRARKADL